MLVTSQNMTSMTRSSVRTRPYIAPANPSRTPANWPIPAESSWKYQRQYSSTSAPTPVTMRVSTQPRTSMFIDRFNPSCGIHATETKGVGPSSTWGVSTSAWMNAAAGMRAAMANAWDPSQRTRTGIRIDPRRNTARSVSIYAAPQSSSAGGAAQAGGRVSISSLP